jgi:hypothetical protein
MNIIYHNSLFFQETVDQLEVLALLGSEDCKYYYMYIDNFNLQLQLPLIELRSPFSPFVPGGPCGPTRPCGPCWPCKPSFPLRPRFPGGLQKGKQILIILWHPSCYSYYKLCDKS